MPWLRMVILGLGLVAGSIQPAGARIQDGSADVCWDPDHEFPVPCDDDED